MQVVEMLLRSSKGPAHKVEMITCLGKNMVSIISSCPIGLMNKIFYVLFAS